MPIRSVSRKLRSLALLFAACIALPHPSLAQPGAVEKLIERMKKEGCAQLESGVKVCGYDYAVNGKAVEAISFRPAGDGRFPGVLLIPGYERTARDLSGADPVTSTRAEAPLVAPIRTNHTIPACGDGISVTQGIGSSDHRIIGPSEQLSIFR